MANSRVEFFGQTLMDVTDTTAVPSSVTKGKVFYQADGQRTIGTAEYQPKIVKQPIALSTSWSGTDPYEQTVLTDQDARYLVDIEMTIEQLASLIDMGVKAIQALNVNGTIVVQCTGAKPTESFSVVLTKTVTFDIEDPVIPEPAEYQPRVVRRVLSLGTEWTGSDPYEQIVLTNQNVNYKIDLQPSAEQSKQMSEAGVTRIQAVNTNGTVTVRCTGGKPTTAMNIQCTKTVTYPVGN